MDDSSADIDEAVFAVVRAIPSGKVMTYGQVADCARGVRLTARQVGGIMRWAPAGVPWHRVVGAGGKLPIGKRSVEMMQLQRRLLAQEGVRFQGGIEDGVDMVACHWRPDLESPPALGLFADGE